jgi:hypothetical protein
MMGLAHRQHFAAAISFHTVGSAVFSPYTLEGVDNPEPDVAQALAKDMVAAAGTAPDEREYEVRPNGYPVAGSDQDWYLHEHGTIAYIVEGTHHNPPLTVRQRAIDATRPMWKTLLDRVARGPRLSGHVRDGEGKPVVATVEVTRKGSKAGLHAGEQWRSRPSDGRFDRMLIGPGRYTVTVRADGYQSWTEEVRIRNRPSDLDVKLQPE